MLEGLVGADLSKIGPIGLLTLTVLLVIFGGLIPRWTHTQRMKDKDQRIAYLEAMVAKRDEQFDRLVENDQLTIRLLEDLRNRAMRSTQ